MVVIVLPILLIVYGILIASLYKNKKGFILSMSLSFVLGIFLVFLITIGIGFLLYEKTNYEIEEDTTTISNGLVVARKKDVIKIKARRFLFLYSYDLYCKPWGGLAFLSYYFYSKEELIEFVQKNSFLMEFVREKDLVKLNLK
jgi:hypothetical protein